MKDIKRKLDQLTYEINLAKNDEPDKMTGVMVRLEELTDLVNKLLILDVRKSGVITNLNSERKRCLRLFFIQCWQQ